MSTSLNGWPIIAQPGATRPGPDNRNPSGFANDDVADVLTAIMWWWHTELETITQWGGWRDPEFNKSLPGSATRSNHMSGTATDANWSRHPFIKTKPKGWSFTRAEHALLRKFGARVNGIIRWGWTFHDEMHFELAPGTTRAQVATAADRIRRDFIPPRTLAEIAVYQAVIGVTADGMHGRGTIAAIRAVQKDWGLTQSGLWDEATKAAHAKRVARILEHADLLDLLDIEPDWRAVAAWQSQNNLTPDGLIGPATLRVMEAIVTRIEDKLDQLLTAVGDVPLKVWTFPIQINSRSKATAPTRSWLRGGNRFALTTRRATEDLDLKMQDAVKVTLTDPAVLEALACAIEPRRLKQDENRPNPNDKEAV